MVFGGLGLSTSGVYAGQRELRPNKRRALARRNGKVPAPAGAGLHTPGSRQVIAGGSIAMNARRDSGGQAARGVAHEGFMLASPAGTVSLAQVVPRERQQSDAACDPGQGVPVEKCPCDPLPGYHPVFKKSLVDTLPHRSPPCRPFLRVYPPTGGILALPGYGPATVTATFPEQFGCADAAPKIA